MTQMDPTSSAATLDQGMMLWSKWAAAAPTCNHNPNCWLDLETRVLIYSCIKHTCRIRCTGT